MAELADWPGLCRLVAFRLTNDLRNLGQQHTVDNFRADVRNCVRHLAANDAGFIEQTAFNAQ